MQIIGYINQFLPVITAADWFEHQGLEIDWDSERGQLQYDLVNNIITLQISLYLLRRTGRCDGSIVDNCRTMLSHAKLEYCNSFGDFKDLNEDVDF